MSVRNSTGTKRTVASPGTRPAIFPRTPAEPPARALADHDRSQRQRLYRCSPRPYFKGIYARLQRVKAIWDLQDVFRHALSVRAFD
ncbi:BBE domain-containing protein [Streptomyces sp. NPDC005356]|uniref:BBE domain-containing protein n=1 Tax=Streptomyces sp. NPDC005356 TaxID=3157167 RepID=UPI0033BC9592